MGLATLELERLSSALGSVGKRNWLRGDMSRRNEERAQSAWASRERAAAQTGGAATGQGGGAGERVSSPVEEQHLPPGVEMGRNGPEHRPGSETPRPLPRSGRRAGRKSLTLTPSPSPSAFRSRPLPSQHFLPGEEEGGSQRHVSGRVPAPNYDVGRGLGSGREVGLEEGRWLREGAGRSSGGEGRGGRCDVTKKNALILEFGRHIGLSVLRVWSGVETQGVP
ncbi:uncharacterized protein LOC131423638 [Marmota monax]|uniref:uncharacterized protein LOC131423638 n=1 Tax=Marmota monax TaxID=9995 RepID=UPI0026EDEC9C|nr:uncharacterized protein LOC131423638 [Marmota monax]